MTLIVHFNKLCLIFFKIVSCFRNKTLSLFNPRLEHWMYTHIMYVIIIFCKESKNIEDAIVCDKKCDI